MEDTVVDTVGTERRRIPLSEAAQLAAEVVDLLAPSCERIVIAGSIRRRRPDIGDIEIVCVPIITREEVQESLFGDTTTVETNRLNNRVGLLLARDDLALRLDKNSRPANGDRYKRLAYKGFALDLFCVLKPAQFGVILAIRTGPANFSHNLVMNRRYGGLMPNHMFCKDGQLWQVSADAEWSQHTATPLETPEEADLFRQLGLTWIEPWERS